jgi:hypothetical protein
VVTSCGAAGLAGAYPAQLRLVLCIKLSVPKLVDPMRELATAQSKDSRMSVLVHEELAMPCIADKPEEAT